MSKAKIETAKKSEVEIRPVRNGRDKHKFIDLPYRLYRHDSHWIAPLRIAQKDILNTDRHPFYKTSDVQMFLALREGNAVGRVMAILNRAHNEFHGERAGFFGFFECENDYHAAEHLFDAASAWLRSHGAELIRGPVNPSTNYEIGLLIDSFDRDPFVMMPYNPPYYGEMIERYGMKKVMDLYTYDILAKDYVNAEKLRRVTERLKKRNRIRVRSVNLKNFKHEVEIVRQVYNEAWSRNWGFVPVTKEEFDHIAKDMKQIVDPDIVMIAEQDVDGGEPRPVGFFLAVPDINQALKKLRGRLLPFGLAKLLWHSRKINLFRVVTMGIVRDLQNAGVGALFLTEIYDRCVKSQYDGGELGWMLENNLLVQRSTELVGCKRGKTYRIFEKSLV